MGFNSAFKGLNILELTF